MESNRARGTQVQPRQSAGHRASIWNGQLIMSLTTPYSHESDGNLLEELKEECRKLVLSMKEPHQQLDLINKMQRLGISYHFHKEIKDILAELVHPNYNASDLYNTALLFRLLRQNGFSITTDVFNKFIEGDGKFKDTLCEDVAGLLSLHEASYLGFPDENVMDEALDFSTKHLLVLKDKVQNEMSEQIRQSLEYPLHWRMSWTEARDFISIYQMNENLNSVLLQFAKLNYNISQSVYLKEVKELVRWWEDLNLKPKLPLARDRAVESYFWGVGTTPELQFSKSRRNIAKYATLLSEFDDMYEVHESINELDKYTEATESWDLKAIEELPEYMKALYEAIYDHVSEMVQDALEDHGIDILPYVKEQWIYSAKTHMKEARWLNNGYNPSADEYLENGWISVGLCPGQVYAILEIVGPFINDYLSEFLEHWHESELIFLPSCIARLLDDIHADKDEMERGLNMNYMYYYMIQEGVSEEVARNHIRGLIRNFWKRLNKATMKYSSRAPAIVKMAVETIRCVHRIFQYGNWWGIQIKENNDCMKSLLEPIPM